MIERATASFVSVTEVPTVLDLTEVLGGREPADADLEAAAEAVRQHVEPEADIHASAEYRRMLAGELARRVLALAAGQAEGHSAGRAATTKGSTSR